MSSKSIKMEFAVKLSCQNCENSIENVLKNEKNIQSYSVDCKNGTVIVETDMSTFQVKSLLLNVSQNVVLRGVSTLATGMKDQDFGSGVSIIQGSNSDTIGVVRLFQVSDDECVAEGTVDGLPPNTTHTLAVHQLGDISNGCKSCGDIFQSERDAKQTAESDESCEPPSKCLKMTSSSKCKVQWLCPPELVCTSSHLVPIYAIQFHQPKLLSSVLTLLSTQYPLSRFTHLKRVKHQNKIFHILLSDSVENCDEILSQLIQKFDLKLEPPQLFLVPAVSPKTRKQFDLYSKHWPCVFHPNPITEQLLSNNCFNDRELERHEYWMSKAFEIIDKDSCPMGVAIVDPKGNSLIARAYDLRRLENSYDHGVMVALDLVAESQGGGANCWSQKYSKFHRADQATLQCSDYLCTGYDVYVSREPCLMCSMALLHSRASRIFFSVPSRTGGLESVWNLQNLTGLNHKLTVFKGLLCEKFFHNHS